MEGERLMAERSEGHPFQVRVPRERVAVIIGKEGESKKQIEAVGEVRLSIQSDTGDVTIIQKGDPLKANITASIIHAIGRGFSPFNASLLYEENHQLIVISLRDFAKPGSRRMEQIRARLIGTGGKTRKVVEELTSTHISIYGDTVSIIGDYVAVEYAKEAMNMLINGSKQRTVYTFLEKNARELRLKRIEESFG